MTPSRSRSLRPAKVRAIAALVVLAGGGALVATSAAASDGPEYRLAAVGTRTTSQQLDEVGVVEPVSQASVSFPTDGTVATVEVATGDVVAVGDVLAALDPTSLERSLHQAESTLAQAELRLERALAGEDVGGGSGAPAGGVSTIAAGGDDLEVQLVAAVVDEELRAAQEAVLAAQQQVDLDLGAADEALADASALCTWAEGSTPDSAAIEACRGALDAVLVAQQAVDASQDALAEASNTYDALLAERAATSTPPTTTPSTPSVPSTPSAPSTPSGPTAPSGSSSGGSGLPGGDVGGAAATASTPSSADLIAYQADVDAAAAEVTVAEQAIAQATIVSPIAGTVTSVGIDVGDDVTAASADQAIAVVGAGGYEVTARVGVADLPDLEVGQPATIRPDGGDAVLDGEVVGISVAPSDGTTGYTVTVALTEPTDDQLRNGGVAAVSITTAGATDVLAIPTSAVTVDGDRATVTVFDGSEAEEVAVELGAIGSTWTEIRSGLDEGQQVVLADLDAALPGSATERSGAGGAEGGGGFQFPGGGGSFGRPSGG